MPPKKRASKRTAGGATKTKEVEVAAENATEVKESNSKSSKKKKEVVAN